MAILKKKEIAAMNIEELQKKLNDLWLERLKVNAQKSSKTAPRKIREIKRTIARILTSANKINKEKTVKK
jgi:large subunit ribosomal protein L29